MCRGHWLKSRCCCICRRCGCNGGGTYRSCRCNCIFIWRRRDCEGASSRNSEKCHPWLGRFSVPFSAYMENILRASVANSPASISRCLKPVATGLFVMTHAAPQHAESSVALRAEAVLEAILSTDHDAPVRRMQRAEEIGLRCQTFQRSLPCQDQQINSTICQTQWDWTSDLIQYCTYR